VCRAGGHGFAQVGAAEATPTPARDAYGLRVFFNAEAAENFAAFDAAI
jgi:hypothetical protein